MAGKALLVVLLAMVMLTILGTPAVVRAEDGIAVTIVYDMSGSMKEKVRDRDGKQTPKNVIANRALLAVVDRLQAFAESSKDRKLNVGLLVFGNDKISEAVPLGDFNAEALRRWAQTAPQPNGGTPLGESLRSATHLLLGSKLDHKHILVITDGANTAGVDPVKVLPELRKEMAKNQTQIGIYFVAFDIAAKVFEPLKKLDVIVASASDEAQLNMQLTFLLQEKMLLEAEDPPVKK
jgi:von Willebrand factor type A domain